jgi:alpha-mannosidase
VYSIGLWSELDVISHLHRDRERNQPFEETRLRLLDLVDSLLSIFEDDPDYVYHLDAQIVCLEDYLEIRTHRREDIKRHIREGRLLVGPWYVQNDFNLCSGESTTRNLLIGSVIAEGWGGCPRVGPAPGQVGLTGQLQQIYTGFNIKQTAGFGEELREGTAASALHGTLSSRPYLKLLNMQCQNLLELVLEPFYSQLSQWTDGAVEYPADLLDYLWKELLKNQAHNSICGCSADREHQDNENRFLRILNTAQELHRRGLNHLVQRIDRSEMLNSDGYILTVVNTLPYDRAEMVAANLQPLMTDDFEAFGLLDERGKAVEFELLDSCEGNLPEQEMVHNHQIRFRLAVPAGGYRTLRLFRKETSLEIGTIIRPAPQGWVMQNEFMRVVVGADGQVDLLDSETGIESPNLFGFEDLADIGDCCRFTPDPKAPPFDNTAPPEVSIIENKGVRLKFALGVVMNLSLDAGSRHLAVDIEVENQQKNHRLRLLVHTDVHSEEHTSSQPFDGIRRSRNPDFSDLSDDWTEPSNGLVSVEDWNKRLSIFNNGLYEFEHLRDARGTIALTLMRSAAWDAPEDQCLRKVSYRLAIRPGQADVTTLMQEMQCFHAPLLAIFDAVDSKKVTGERLFVGDTEFQEYGHRLPALEEQVLPLTREGFKVDPAMVFSAYKRSHDRAAWIVRFFNPAETPVDVKQPVFNAEISELDERKGGEAWSAVNTVGAKKIVTLRF